MDTILQVKGLCKKYEDFALDHVSFTLPRGCITVSYTHLDVYKRQPFLCLRLE